MSKFHMGKQEREITDESIKMEILKRGKYMVLGLCKENQPYVVCLSYGYDTQRHAIYFHCAEKGLKMDYLLSNPQVCATVIEDHGYVVDDCTQNYRSLVLWGKIFKVVDLKEKIQAFKVMFQHLEGENETISARMLDQTDAVNGVGVLRLDIEQIDAKSNV